MAFLLSSVATLNTSESVTLDAGVQRGRYTDRQHCKAASNGSDAAPFNSHGKRWTAACWWRAGGYCRSAPPLRLLDRPPTLLCPRETPFPLSLTLPQQPRFPGDHRPPSESP